MKFVDGDRLGYCGDSKHLEGASADVVADDGSDRVDVIEEKYWFNPDPYSCIRSGGWRRPSAWRRTSCKLKSAFPHTDPGDPPALQPPRSKKTRIKTWQRHSFLNGHSKGFHHDENGHEVDHLNPTRIASRIATIHGELSEALEECARGRMDLWYGEDGKPEGFGIELADVFLRLVDLAETTGVDLEEMICIKHAYNVTRPIRHGGKKL